MHHLSKSARSVGFNDRSRKPTRMGTNAPHRKMATAIDKEEIMRQVQDSKHEVIKLAVVDIDGVPRGKYVNKEKFASVAKNGLGFCSVVFGWDSQDVLYDNTKQVGWHMGYGDFDCKVDLSSFRKIPWEDGLPFFLMDFENSKTGEKLEIAPRTLLKKVIDDVHKEGYNPVCGFEFEWFNFRETPQSLQEKKFRDLQPLTPGMFGYSILRSGQNKDFFHSVVKNMGEFGVPIEGIHTETGPGVLEAAIQFSNDTLEAADRAVLFKMGLKDIAYKFGIMPCFMAKPAAHLPGNGAHMHQNLADSNGKNLFYDEKADDKMSTLFRHYLAGQLHCLPYLMPMYAPTVNSYKRLVAGYWAPVRPTWAYENRTSSLRVIPGGKATRVEVRVPGADANPYLSAAASVASGLYGVKHKLELPPVTSGNSYATNNAGPMLPRNLSEATKMMANSDLAKELLGETFVEHFTATREWEWRQYANSVTNWEVERYFEII